MGHVVESGPLPHTDAWVRSTLDLLAGLPGVRRVGLALTEGGGRRLLFAASDRDNDPAVDWCEIDAYEDVPLTAAVRTGSPVVGSPDELADVCPEFAERQLPQTQALAAVPLAAAGQVLGGFVLFYDAPQSFDGPHVTRLDDLGARLGARLRQVQRASARAGSPLAQQSVPAEARTATCAVPADPRAVRAARHFLGGVLAGWDLDEDAVDTAVLCLSELVTNAIIHTSGGCELRVLLDRGVLTVAVRDDGAESLPASEPAVEPAVEPLAVHGRGLRLVDALASRWGSDLDAVGTTVWFVLEV